jgi:hypothetical protein
MDYLSKTVTLHTCSLCSDVYGESEVHCDQYTSDVSCPRCLGDEHELTSSERPAEWWSVAVYRRGRSYGGPEEGGWWYDTGSLTEHRKMRVFEDFAEAEARVQELYAWIQAEGWLKELGVVGFTEKLPVSSYPERRPRYS